MHLVPYRQLVQATQTRGAILIIPRRRRALRKNAQFQIKICRVLIESQEDFTAGLAEETFICQAPTLQVVQLFQFPRNYYLLQTYCTRQELVILQLKQLKKSYVVFSRHIITSGKFSLVCVPNASHLYFLISENSLSLFWHNLHDPVSKSMRKCAH